MVFYKQNPMLPKIIPAIFFIVYSFISCAQEIKAPLANASGKPRFIWTTEWSSDGKYIAVGGDDSTIWVYDGKNYNLLKAFKSNSAVKGLRWHPKEHLLAIANMKGVQMLNLDTETITTFANIRTGGRAIGWNYTGELIGLADGRGMVQIMDKNGKILRSIPKNDNNSYLSIDWHPSKNIIVTGGDEIILLDTSGRQLNAFKVREQYTGILTVKWHPSGEFFASGDYGHEKEGKPTLLQYWKEDGTKLKEMSGHHEEIRNLRWSADGKYVATAADALRIWDTEGQLLYTGASDRELWGIAWSMDGKHIVTGAFGDGKVKLWNNHAEFIKEISD
jgi:WD40 repeat protein